MRLCAMFLATTLVALGCAQEKVSDPVAAYKEGKLFICGSSSDKITYQPSDVVALLEKSDAVTMNEWAKKRFESAKDIDLSDEILFVHKLPRENLAPDALFTYYHLKKDQNFGYCETGGSMNGTTPFNEQLLEKYGKKNPS